MAGSSPSWTKSAACRFSPDAVPEYLENGFRSEDLEEVLVDWLSNGCWETVVCEKEYGQVNAFLEKCWPDVIKQMKESINVNSSEKLNRTICNRKERSPGVRDLAKRLPK